MVFVYPASGGTTEADIRIIAATFTGFVVFATVSAQAAPLPPLKRTGGQLDACPPIEKLAQERGSGGHSVPCHERWGHCHSDNCFPMGSENPYWPRRAARMSIIPPALAGMGALEAVSVHAVSSNKNENRRPPDTALSFGLGDQGCGGGWHQALWLDWRDEWWWGPCVPNR